MTGFGLRLALHGDREAVTRLLITAGAVALGVVLLLTTLAGINAVGAQNDRYGWLQSGQSALTQPPVPDDGSVDPLWWELRADYLEGQVIARVDVAATGAGSPVPPGIPALPGPGELYVSPAMSHLLATTPDAQLGDRYPGREIGLIGDEALPSPDSLVVVVGHAPDELAGSPHAQQITSISTSSPADCGGCDAGIGINANGIALILGVVAAALVLPVLVFIASATRLSAARREQRFAAMRLVGATPRQIATISATESVVAATLGLAVGFVAFLLARPLLAHIPFTGTTFFGSDLALSATDVVLVALGVPIAATLAARIALRRVTISPLGVVRRATPRPPRPTRLVLLVIGLAELGYLAVAGPPESTSGQVLAFVVGIALVMLGLVVAGPWLTMAGARLLAVRTGRPPVLLAGRRLADDPRAGFRAISGLILALFVGTVAVASINTFVEERAAPAPGTLAAGTLVRDFLTITPAGAEAGETDVPVDVLARLAQVDGVTGVAVIRTDPDKPAHGSWLGPGLVTCAELAAAPALGRCAPGSAATQVVEIAYDGDRTDPATVWPTSPRRAAALGSLPASAIAVSAQGRPDAVEESRTILETAFPQYRTPTTVGEFFADDNRLIEQYQQLVDVVIAISLVVAGCSLAVGVAGGVSDRRRPFALLRLTGVPLRTLRRVVLLESLVPLLAGALVAIAAGLVAAQLFVSGQLDYTLHPPGEGFFAAVAVGFLGAVALIASTFPFLRRSTGPEAARND